MIHVRNRKVVAASFYMIVPSLIVLSACAANGTSRTSTPMPPISEMDAAMSAPAPEPVAGMSDTLTTMDNNDTSFADAPASTDARIAALEQSVKALRADYDSMIPAFASLKTTNERIDALLSRMESQNGAEAMPTPIAATGTPPDILPPTPILKTAPPVKPSMAPPAKVITSANAPDLTNAKLKEATGSGQVSVTRTISQSRIESPRPVVPAPEKPALASPVLSTQTTTTTTAVAVPPASIAAAKPAFAKSGSVTGLRIGEHGTKTRLVFDLGGSVKPDFKYDIDNAEKLLLVEMPSSAWAGATAGKPNSPMISVWNAQTTPDGGSTVAIQLKKDARILSTEFLKAEGKDPARMVVDIAPGV